jgi:hypothetical protein
MNAKEQANELVNKYSELLSVHVFNGTYDIAKQCALIAVDIAVDELLYTWYKVNDKYWAEEDYWEQVKLEIQKL